MPVEEIALHLRDHQTELADWRYSGLARDLHAWVETFDFEFKLDLPAYPAIKFETIRKAYATYAAFRGSYGEKDVITFNTNELGRDPAEVLATLLHELLHLHQQYYGQPGQRNFHNKEFRAKALACGLIVDSRGCHSGYTEVFAEVLRRHGLRVSAMTKPLKDVQPVYGAGKRQQKLKKYSCRCTNVRCATPLAATCNRCGAQFIPS